MAVAKNILSSTTKHNGESFLRNCKRDKGRKKEIMKTKYNKSAPKNNNNVSITQIVILISGKINII